MVQVGGRAARAAASRSSRLDGLDPEDLRTAAARVVRAQHGGGTIAWALDESLPMAQYRQVQAVVEGAVLGGYDAGRWKSDGAGARRRALRRLRRADPEHAEIAARAELVARWTNVARELVDGPPNVVDARRSSPSGRRRSRACASRSSTRSAAGLPALAAVGGSGAAPPRLIVLRHEPEGAPARPRLALVGKAVTFDAGGYFLKPQSDIVRQKGDMAGGAAVLAALGAIAELELPLDVVGVLPACENMIGPDAIRPSDVITTAAGLTVEVTNPDAEGRLILADALWYARRQGATHVIDLATLTGAMRAGMGDLYGGVFANDDNWRDAIVDAGNAAGDLAWPWPLHRALPPPARVAGRRPAQHLGAALRVSDHRRGLPRALRRRGPVGARRHARARAARRRPRRRDRRGGERLRRAHARRGRLAPGRRARSAARERARPSTRSDASRQDRRTSSGR